MPQKQERTPKRKAAVFESKGVTKVDYFHFQCTRCNGSVDVRLGPKDGSVLTIFAECDKCGENGTFKLARTH